MKDITITGSRIKRESIILAVCFVAAIGLNIYAISKYDTDWSELIGQLHVVIFTAFVIYFLVMLFRLVILGITRLIQKK
jgi:hypothetical protein